MLFHLSLFRFSCYQMINYHRKSLLTLQIEACCRPGVRNWCPPSRSGQRRSPAYDELSTPDRQNRQIASPYLLKKILKNPKKNQLLHFLSQRLPLGAKSSVLTSRFQICPQKKFWSLGTYLKLMMCHSRRRRPLTISGTGLRVVLSNTKAWPDHTGYGYVVRKIFSLRELSPNSAFTKIKLSHSRNMYLIVITFSSGLRDWIPEHKSFVRSY